MNKKIKIVADSKIPFLKGVLDFVAEVEYLNPAEITKDSVKDADALIIRTRTKCNKDLLGGTKVKFIATATIGYDHIDTNYCDDYGIKWINAPGCNSSSVQQYIASALLSIAKKNNLDLEKLTIGIVGVGNVGSKVETLCRLFGMKVLLNDPPRERVEGNHNFVSLDTIIEQSVIITFHVPLNKSGVDRTLHLADKQFFQKLSPGKILINSSRGEVIDSVELKKAIDEGKISSCVLDVWENEPDINEELLSKVDIGTPHIAGYSADGKANGTAMCVNAINEFFGLGINKWYPESVPSPRQSKCIQVDCNGKSKQDVLFESIMHTYNVLDDDERLRDSVITFEKQRHDYPVRREFPFYTVDVFNENKDAVNILSKLGFNVDVEDEIMS